MISNKSLVTRSLLQQNILKLNRVILPGFDFKEIKKEDKPYDYLISLVLNKLYSLNVTLENNLLCNDVHQSVTAYRYMYELYIKMLSIFSETNTKKRIEDFYTNKDVKIKTWLDGISVELMPPNFFNKHKDHYVQMSRFAHPNIDSLNMHYGKTDDQIFDFIVLNIKLTIWLQVNLLILFTQKATTSSFKMLDTPELNLILSRLDDRN